MPRLSFDRSLLTDIAPLSGADIPLEIFKDVLLPMLLSQIQTETPPSVTRMGKVAKQLGMESAEEIIKAFNALVFVVMEFVSSKSTVEDFDASIADLKLATGNHSALVEVYTNEFDGFRQAMLGKTLRLPHYHNIDWRLDVVLATRSLQQQAEPVFLMELETRDKDNEASFHTLNADFATLSHICQELQAALEETSSKHSKRVLRYIG